MKLATIGIGSAGSRVVNQILDTERATGRNLTQGNTLLINAEAQPFDETANVPAERRVLIGDVAQEPDEGDVVGELERAADVARGEHHELNRAFDVFEFHQVDGILVVADLAGAMGGGAGAVVIKQLQAICDDPVYAVGILPSESEGEAAAMSAARSLQSFVEYADNVILFDNETWQGEASIEQDEPETAEDSYEAQNVVLAERLVNLFGAGEISGGTSPEHLLDPSDVIRTLEIGGISSIGFASTEVRPNGTLARWLHICRERLPWLNSTAAADDEEEATDAAKINQLVRRAVRSQLTLPCTLGSADRALIVLSGPSHALSRRGFESGRYWLEREADIVEVLAGDDPNERSSTLSVTVLLANVTEVPRIEAMQGLATQNKQGQRVSVSSTTPASNE